MSHLYWSFFTENLGVQYIWAHKTQPYFALSCKNPAKTPPALLLLFPSSHTRDSKPSFGNLSYPFTFSCPHSTFSFSKQTLDLTSLPSYILTYTVRELAAEPEQSLAFG